VLVGCTSGKLKGVPERLGIVTMFHLDFLVVALGKVIEVLREVTGELASMITDNQMLMQENARLESGIL